jgi:hypothetical protein
LRRHVDFLSTLYLAWGAIFAVVALAGFALAGGAAAIAAASDPVRVASEMAARLTAFTFILLSIIALVWSALHLWIGRSLRHYRASARMLALGLAVGNLILLPFGSALGFYACWVLLHEEGRRIFETDGSTRSV